MKKLPFVLAIQANADNDEPAEVSIRGVIGTSFDMETWTMKSTEDEVLNELAKIPKGKKIKVLINSPGGDFGLALGCYNAIASRYDDVTTQNCGYACSAASCIMLAGKNRISPVSCNWMIHCGNSGIYGNAEDHQKSLNALNSIDKTMAAIYCKASGVGTPEEWLEKMKKETWYTGAEACDAGLGTCSEGETEPPEIEMTAESRKIFAGFKHLPENLRSRISVKAQAANPAPTNQNKNQTISMKKTIAALVALGFPCAENASDDDVASLVTSSVTGVRAERERFKTEVQTHIDARKNRITAAVESAITDKLIPETRKAGMIEVGCATAAGETEIVAQLVELRAAAARIVPRGARPVARGAGEGEDTIESLLEQQQAAIESNDGEEMARVNAALKAKRGRGDLFKAEPLVAAAGRG